MLIQVIDRARRTGKQITLVLDSGSTFTSNRALEEMRRIREWVLCILVACRWSLDVSPSGPPTTPK